MSKVVSLADYRAKRDKDKRDAEYKEAIRRILARCPIWPDDPPEKK